MDEPDAFDEPIFERETDEPLRAVTLRQTSTAAILSFVFGALSPMLACTLVLWFPMALAAIVAGHVARYQIRKSAGMLHGDILAVIGIMTGYTVLSTGTIIVVMIAAVPRSPPPPAAPGTLVYAEERVTAADRVPVAGRPSEALQVASRFVELLRALDDDGPIQIGERQSFIGDECFVWCELRPGKCALIVEIDEYDRLSAETQDVLEKTAWSAAQNAVTRASEPVKMVAVGLKDRSRYRSVTFGKVGPGRRELENIVVRGSDGDVLEVFFTDDSLDSLGLD